MALNYLLGSLENLVSIKNTQAPISFTLELTRNKKKIGVACNMYFNTILPGLEDVTITKTETVEDSFHLNVELKVTPHRCPACGEKTKRVHDSAGSNHD